VKLNVQFPTSEYWLVGEGPEKRRLEALTRRLGLVDSIHFMGGMSRMQVLEKMVACDVLMNPSLHDSGSCVCTEAMAVGLPVICLDLGGPALQVTEDTGIKVPATSPGQVIEDMAAAMIRLASDPLCCERLSKAAQTHVRETLTWERKGAFIAATYNRVATSV